MKRILMVLILLIPALASGNEASKAFYDGVSHYEAGRYDEALAQFLTIAQTGTQNGKLAYNIGNTWMQKREVGKAILWYERAARLMPGDPDLIFNRNVALAQVKDRPEERETPMLSVLFFWKRGIPLKTLQGLAIGAGLLLWTLALAGLFWGRPPLKSATLIVGALFAVLASTAIWDTATRTGSTRAVILPSAVSIRSGLSDTATELFTLHSGSQVSVEKERGDWVRIVFAEGKIGWVKKESVGVI